MSRAIANPFAHGYREMENAFAAGQRANLNRERANMIEPNFNLRKQGLDLRRQALAQNNARMLRMGQFNQARLALDYQRLQEQMREFEIQQKRLDETGGMTPYQKERLDQQRDSQYYLGKITKQFTTPDGLVGTYKNDPNLSKIDDKVKTSMPLLADSMSTILNGIQSYLTGGGNLNRMLAAVTAYATGTATPSQEKLLTQSGMTLDAITMAAESLQNVSNLPKIEATYGDIRKMLSPRKGDTLQSVASRLNETFKEQKKRASLAEFRTTYGIPQDPTAKIAQTNFLREFNNTDQYGSVFEKGLPESKALPKAYSENTDSEMSESPKTSSSPAENVTPMGSNVETSSSNISEDDIKNFMYIMSQKGVVMNHDAAKQALESIRKGGQS